MSKLTSTYNETATNTIGIDSKNMQVNNSVDNSKRATFHNRDTESPLVSQLSQCTTISQFKEQVFNIIKELEFTDFSFTVVGAPSPKSLTTLPDMIAEQYIKQRLYECDILMEHAEHSSRPLFQSTLEDYIAQCPFSSDRLTRNIHLFKTLASLGYHDRYCVSQALRSHSHKALFSLYAKNCSRSEFFAKVEQYKPVLPFLIEAVTYFAFTLFPEQFLNKTPGDQQMITPKPLRLLRTIAQDGLMLKEAANKLCISLDTANKHVATAKQALGATTLANAVYLAMINGFLCEEDSHSTQRRG
jgi:hypothetical protein